MVQDNFWEHYGGEDEESREIAHDDWYHDGGDDEESPEIAHDDWYRDRGDDEESPEIAIFNPFSRGHNGGEDEDPRG